MPRYQNYSIPRVDLGEAFYEYLIEQTDFVGIRALTLAPVPRPSAKFPKISRGEWLRSQRTERAMGAAFRRVNYAATDDSYNCKEYAAEFALDDTERARLEYDFDAALAGLQFATQAIMREQEERIASALFNTSTWTGSDLYTDYSANPWSNPATDIFGQLSAARAKVRKLTGMTPNKLLVSWTTRENMLKNDDFRDFFKFAGNLTTRSVQLEALAAWAHVDEVLAGAAVKNAADEGRPVNLQNIWSDQFAMLLVAAPQNEPRLMIPCVGRTMIWEEVGTNMVRVEQYRDETIASDVYRVRQSVDEKVIDPSFAHLMKIG